jgi:hypothetical protein
MKETSAKLNAKVILCKCPRKHGSEGSDAKTFGIRIEEQRGDWVRTWAFKIDEDKAKREGFDKTPATGTLNLTPEYPGCPYCGTNNLAQCSCGKLFCWSGESNLITCPWCGRKGEYKTVEKLSVKGGGF